MFYSSLNVSRHFYKLNHACIIKFSDIHFIFVCVCMCACSCVCETLYLIRAEK